jgi:hypothetical protein
VSKNVKIVQRLFLALPNAVTAAVMLTVWIAPTLFGAESVRNFVPTMLYEFLVIHSTLFYVALPAQSRMPRFKRIAAYVGLTAFYMIFITIFSLGFDSSWPIFTFGWLFSSRFISLWTHPDLSNNDDNMIAFWLMSVVCFFGGAMAMLLLPIPPIGFTPDFIESLHLSGAGGLVTKPYTEIAWGVFYFGALACFKFFVVVEGSADDNKIYRRDDLDVEHGTFREGAER